MFYFWFTIPWLKSMLNQGLNNKGSQLFQFIRKSFVFMCSLFPALANYFLHCKDWLTVSVLTACDTQRNDISFLLKHLPLFHEWTANAPHLNTAFQVSLSVFIHSYTGGTDYPAESHLFVYYNHWQRQVLHWGAVSCSFFLWNHLPLSVLAESGRWEELAENLMKT